MNNIFKKGETKQFTKVVQTNELASFETGIVHPVYSTFALARDAEWSGRLFVLEMKEDDEEGIGTSISIQHKSPAFQGEEILFTATFEEITERNEIITSFVATSSNRVIAKGTQGQMILKKEKIKILFDSVKGK
jgi:fluoroacetyl-CoA thioesterase